MIREFENVHALLHVLINQLTSLTQIIVCIVP